MTSNPVSRALSPNPQIRRESPGAQEAPAVDRVEIIGAEELPAETLQKLQSTASRAVQFFEGHFGSVAGPVKLDVRAGQQAMRTGYNPTTDTVCFPRLRQIKNSGLDSVDIINHEIFHALVSQSYPMTSKQDLESTRMHEALADYFAYQLNPDESFGENFLVDKAQLRSYRNDLELSLTSGPHAQGNAITSLLLKHDISPEQIHEFLQRGDFSVAGLGALSSPLQSDLARDASFELAEHIGDYPPSALRRYRIIDEQPLQLTFKANDSLKQVHPNLQVRWVTPEGLPSQHYRITSSGTDSFSIEKSADVNVEKMLAMFYDGEALVGSRPFYFTPEVGGSRDQSDWLDNQNVW